MALLKGKAAAPGVALAIARIYQKKILVFSSRLQFSPERESQRWQDALVRVRYEIQSLYDRYKTSGPKESAEILEAHLLMTEDPEWRASIEKLLSKGHQAEYSVNAASEEFAKMLENLSDAYLRQRSQDIRDVAQRVLQALNRTVIDKVSNDEVILFAEDLLPSELLSLYNPNLKAVVLEKGNPTSHTTILARTFELPLVLKVKDALSIVREGDLVGVNGLKGSVAIHPSDKEIVAFEQAIAAEKAEQGELASYVTQRSVTLDGVHVEVASNLNSLMDLDFALRKGSEGIGLFRTEFLLMDRHRAPSEDEQFAAYKRVVQEMAPYRAVIRTFDIGGDKQVSYLDLPKEDNPFLGLRGIRFCLKEKPLFKLQLRALVRASQCGRLAIMAPMVSRVEEVLEFRQLLAEVTEELREENVDVSREPEIGIMIEVPSAAMVVDQIAPHVDFMSVGTNDLLQYLCATDRMNSAVADLHDSHHPAVLRTLQMIAHGVKGTNVWLGMCGEMAAQHDYIPLLLALGFNELSVSPGAVLRTRKRVLSLRLTACRELLAEALTAASSAEMLRVLNPASVEVEQENLRVSEENRYISAQEKT